MGRKKTGVLAGSLSSFLSKRRKEYNLSIRALAAASEVNASYLSQLESNHEMSSPTPEFLYKIHNTLDVTFSELLFHAGYLGPREEDTKSIYDKRSLPKILLTEVPILLSRIVIETLGISIYTTPEKRFKNLITYLCKKNDRDIADVLLFKDLKATDVDFYLNKILTIYLIEIAKKLHFDPDEFLFLAARIPDKFLDEEYIPEFSKKLRLFKTALENTNMVALGLNKHEELQSPEISNSHADIYKQSGEWALYELIRNELKYINKRHETHNEIINKDTDHFAYEVVIDKNGKMVLQIPLTVEEYTKHVEDIINLFTKIKQK